MAAPNRVGSEDNEYGNLAVTFYGSSQFVDPTGCLVGPLGSRTEEVIRDLDMDMVRKVRAPGSSTATGAPTPTSPPQP